MADLSPAEIMLDSLVPAQRLIRQLQAAIKAPVSRVGTDLPQPTRAKIAAFQGELQSRIDALSAQREKAAALVRQIPDQTARTVIELRYGLIGSGYELMPYPEVGETLSYADKTILSYRKRGIAQLNKIMEGEKA